MQFLTLVVLAAGLVHFSCANPAPALRAYERRRDLDNIKPVSELGWTVPLLSGRLALPRPAADKKLKYLTLGRGVITYECNSTIPGDDQPAYLHQNTDLYDVAPLVPHLPDEAALHALVPMLCEFDYAELRNISMNCVGQIYTQLGHTIMDLFGFDEPEFTTDITRAIPSPLGPTVNGYWAHSATIDRAWEVYRVETAGGVTPTSCKGHENTNIDVGYAAEYWFYHA